MLSAEAFYLYDNFVISFGHVPKHTPTVQHAWFGCHNQNSKAMLRWQCSTWYVDGTSVCFLSGTTQEITFEYRSVSFNSEWHHFWN